MAENKKYVELLWHQKYDKLKLGEKIPIKKPNLPFQTVETINEPRAKTLQEKLFEKYPENHLLDWYNLLIWSDNKLVMSSLIKQGWAGKINLIYIDPPFFKIDTKVEGKEVILKINDFQIPPTAELAEIASKVKDSREFIDYWAIDWDYKGDTFHNQWQSFRTKENPRVDYEARHKYNGTKEFQIMVTVVHVFGNDTNKVLKVRVK